MLRDRPGRLPLIRAASTSRPETFHSRRLGNMTSLPFHHRDPLKWKSTAIHLRTMRYRMTSALVCSPRRKCGFLLWLQARAHIAPVSACIGQLPSGPAASFWPRSFLLATISPKIYTTNTYRFPAFIHRVSVDFHPFWSIRSQASPSTPPND